jgi:hypothetical protein
MDITKLALDAGGVFLPFRDSIWSWDFEPHHLRRFAELVAADHGCAECGVTSSDDSMYALYCVNCFSQVIDAAVLAEREACAKLVEGYTGSDEGIVQAIRERHDTR